MPCWSKFRGQLQESSCLRGARSAAVVLEGLGVELFCFIELPEFLPVMVFLMNVSFHSIFSRRLLSEIGNVRG